jgi:outer membrane biosynthesis protein TonB
MNEPSEKPPWRKAIEDYERLIGAPLEDLIKSDQFADMAANAAKQGQAPQGLGAIPGPGLGGAGATQWLHSMGLPAASDIDELRAEIGALRDDLRALIAVLAPTSDAAPTAAPEAKATPAPEPKAAPKPKATGPKPKPKPKPKAAAAAKPKATSHEPKPEATTPKPKSDAPKPE